MARSMTNYYVRRRQLSTQRRRNHNTKPVALSTRLVTAGGKDKPPQCGLKRVVLHDRDDTRPPVEPSVYRPANVPLGLHPLSQSNSANESMDHFSAILTHFTHQGGHA